MSSNITIFDPNGTKITLPFDEMGIYIDKLVEKLINENSGLKYKYELFKKDYKTFKPNLDFLLCIVGYTLENPFDKNVLLEGIDNKLYDRNTFFTNYPLMYPRVTDENLNVHKISTDDVETGFIDPNGTMYSCETNDLTHLKLSELLGINILLYNKDIYDRYLETKDRYSEITDFFQVELNFIRTVIYKESKSGILIYEINNISDFMNELIYSIKQFYSNMYEIVSVNGYLMNKEDAKDASKRLRF